MSSKTYKWCIVGAGPAGIASVGLLLDAGITASDILWIDPKFQVGDFGAFWGEVSSNTTVKLFLGFLTDIKSFNYSNRPHPFELDSLPLQGFTQLKKVAEPLQWVTDHLRQTVSSVQGLVEKQDVKDGYWNLTIQGELYLCEKVILATGSDARSLKQNNICEVSLSEALSPNKLQNSIDPDDCVAVYGSSHSAMIIIRNLLEAGAKKVINFYLSPVRYAVRMENYTLYDNTGLKGETAKWTRENISKRVHPHVERYVSDAKHIEQYLPTCNKAVYAIGFNQRTPEIENFNPKVYDTSCGIIAPGLFGTGIAFPKKVTDPNGNQELNVGLWKFMNDIKTMLPIWINYGL